jgi:transposase
LEDAVGNDKRYIWLAGGLVPDHSTISRFRKDRYRELKAIYAETVRLCAEAGLVLLKTTSTDGTKIASRASMRSFYDAKRLDRESEAIEQILREAEEVDGQEDEMYGSGKPGELPDDLVDKKARLSKLSELAAKLKESGRSHISSTDERAHLMKTSAGIRPAYNVQLTVDSAESVIVAADVTTNETDNGQLAGQLEQVVENVGLRPDVALGDTGYSDERTFGYLESTGQEAIIPPRRQPQERKRNDLFASKCFLKEDGQDALICPAGRRLKFYRQAKCSSGTYREYRASGCRSCSLRDGCVGTRWTNSRRIQISTMAEQRQKMFDKLATDEGRGLYALRRQTVEPVIGNIKWNMGLDRFVLDGKEGTSSETWLACAAHNLMIYVRKAASGARTLLSALTWVADWAAMRYYGDFHLNSRGPAQLLD